MASVPNMRLTPSPAGKGQAAGAEAPEADIFARLMAAPIAGAVAEGAASLLAGESGETATKPSADEPAGDDPKALDLGLPAQAADFLPLIEAQAAAPVAAKPAKASDADETAAVSPEAQPLARDIGMTACGLPIASPIAATPAPTVPVAQPVALPMAAPIQPPVTTTAPGTRAPAPKGQAPAADAPAIHTTIAALPTAVEQVLRVAAKPARAEPVPGEVAVPSDAASPAVQLTASLFIRATRQEGEKAAARPAAETAAPAAPLPSPAQGNTAPVSFVPTVDLPPASASGPTQSAAPARSAEPTFERELDLAHDSEWLDQLARDIAGAGEREGPMRFRLHPQTLGHLRVELSQSDLGTSVRLTADTEAARAILVDAQPRLVAEARAQGIRIAESHVDLAGSGERGTADSRRQEGERPDTIVRTAGGGAEEAEASTETRRSESERYA